MKKLTSFLAALLLIATGIIAQAPDFEWTQQGQGQSNVNLTGRAIAVDGSGNSYVTGYFQGRSTFGSTTLYSSSFQIFIAKYDATGNTVWVQKAGVTSGDNAFDIAIDGSGNSYVTGRFSGTATFGSTTFTSSGNFDIFIAKYDAAGNAVWAQKAGGTGPDFGNGIIVDGSGNSYVTGSFQSNATFGSTVLTSSGTNDIFIAKYDATGNVMWAQKAGGTQVDDGFAISIDGLGNSYVTGRFQTIATFGSTVLTASGAPGTGTEIFIAKYDANGNTVWAKQAGGVVSDLANDIATDENGNSYITGLIGSTASFGSIILTPNNDNEIFIAKYDAIGNVVWAQKAGGAGNDFADGIAIDASGNSYVTGSFSGIATFGSITLTSSGDFEIFNAKFDTDGNAVWAQKAGGTGLLDNGYGIAVDGSGNTYGTGRFQSTATFGSTTLTSSGFTDIYIVKYNALGILVWAQNPVTFNSDDIGRSIATDVNGNSYVTGSFTGNVTFGSTVLTSSGINVAALNTFFTDIFIVKYDAAGNVVWAKKAGGISSDIGISIAVDGSGNSYVTGSFSGTATFGSTTLTSSGSNDIFIAKYNSAGNEVWAIKAGGIGSDNGNSIAVDGSGNIYVTGSFSGSATFGSFPLSSTGSNDIFIAKYNAAGTAVWAKNAGGTLADFGRGIATDENGNSFVTGYFQSSATFGSTILSSSGDLEIFIAKYDAAGNTVWAQKAGGTGTDLGTSIIVDGSGNSYLTGFFTESATFGSANLTSSGMADIFIAKYDATGNVVWVQKAGGTTDELGNAIDLDGCGNIYVTGGFRGSTTFGSTTLTSIGGIVNDIFIAKYDPSGNAMWAQKAGGTENDVGNSIAVYGYGNIYVTGSFFGSATFGSNTFFGQGTEMFIAKLNSLPAAIPSAPTVTSPVTYCRFATAIALTATGTNLLWYTMAAGGPSSATAPIPSTTTPGTTNYYVSQKENNCESLRAQITVIVSSAGLTVSCPTYPSVCIDAAAFALSGGLPTGGTYSGTGVSAGIFTPATAGAGTHTITYTYTDVNGCSSCSFTITVNVSPVIPVISGTLCAAGSTLTVSPTNGIASLTWSLNGTPVSTVDSVLTVAGGNGQGVNPNQLSGPRGVYIDVLGNVYVSDNLNNRIQRWAPGATTGTTVAGGNGAGTGLNQLSNPRGVYVDASFNVYVADQNNHRIQRWDPGATTGITVAGGNGSGPGQNQLSFPNGVYVDGSGNVYVADRNNQRIQRWAPGATTGITVAGGNGQGANANQLNFPSGVYVDVSGNMYIAELNNHRIQRWASGATTGTTVAGGNGSGVNLNQLTNPSGVYVDGSANVYVSDFGNHRIQRWPPGTTTGTTVAGGNGQGANANQLNFPSGVYVDGSVNVYVADLNNHRIQLFTNAFNDSLPNAVVGTYTVTVRSFTGCSVSSAPVTVGDNQPPATPTLADVNVGECSGTPTAPTTTDNCAGTITGTTTTVFPITTQGTTVVTWTFNDGNGNSTTANQNVIINDVTNPVITCPANTFVQYGNDESPAANGTATATDNCAGVSVGTPSDVTVNGPGNNKTITRTWTATDGVNNSATCNQTITVCDLGVSLGNDRFVFFGIPGQPGTTAVITATISGGLTGVTYLWSSTNVSVNGLTTQSVTPTGYLDAQAITYTVTATAPNGCTATASVTITYFNINCSNNNNTVKVKVCFIPQGNPTNCNSICVTLNAYETLLNNGSYLGKCLPNCAVPPARRIPDISNYIVEKQTLDVKVFSNPSHTFFRLYVYGDFYQKVSLRVIDMYGRVIDQKNNLNTEQEIRIGDSYIAGVYMVEVMQGKNSKVVKLVKQ